MIGSKLGRYTVVSELGSGGMGSVYLGVSPSGRRVALKVVHPFLIATPGFFKRFLLEGEVGKRVKHENVVRTLEVDATLVGEQQVNFMVMEYVEGKSLRKLLLDLGTVPETLLREIAVQMAAGLAAIHEQGIIHRDLKPENVLITHDHVVRIMDLGVAKLQEASVAITREGQFAGSYLYAAPEQFKKEEVGAPADLYALGVMLYELATGGNPFGADDTSAIVNAHLHVEPPRLSERTEISPFFAEVVHTLLAKAPAARFTSAGELRDVLERREASAWWKKRESRLRVARARLPAIRVPRESDVFGRAKELAVLREAWERVKLGEGCTVLIEGEPGIGRTRLLDAFARELAAEEAHILYGAYTPGGGLGGLSEAIIGKFGSVNLAEGLAPYIAETPTLVHSFAALVKHETPPAGAEPLQIDALHTVGCHLFRNLAADKPSLWAIDELQFAPRESLNFVIALARTVATQRTMLVLTARSGELGKDLEHFARLENFRHLELGRLSPREVIELLREVFRSEILADKLGAQIAYKSDGVPLFVFEMVRSLKEGALLKQAADGSYVLTDVVTEIEVPSAVRDLIGARLKDLSDDDRILLDTAAVQGFEFDPDLVARVADIRAIQVLQRLAALERRSGIVRAAGARYRFDHHQIQEVLYGELPEGLRKGYHALVAEAYEAREGLRELDEPAPDAAYFVAIHHLRGKTPRAAKRYLRTALGHVNVDYRNDSHIALCDLALGAEGVLDDRERCETLIAKGTSHGHLGQRPDEGAAIEEAVRLADAIGDATLRCEARGRYGWHLWALGQYPESQAVFEEALAIARAAGDAGQERALGGRLASVLSTLGHQEKALELQQSQNNRGLCFQYLGRYAEARACFETEAREQSRDRRALGIALVNLGRLQAALGDPEAGRKTLEEARTTLHAAGLRRPESYALHRLGAVAEQMGDDEKAEQLYEQALALRREIQYASGVVETLLALGRLRKRQEKKARALLKEAQAMAREIDRPDEIVLSAVHLGDVTTAEAALKSHGARMRVPDRMKAHLELWKATSRPDHLEEARRLHEHLLAHAPEECREAMVKNVPLHRELEEATA